MQSKKQINTKNYTTKKHHEKYDKRNKIAKKERKQKIPNFASMSAEALLEFMEDKLWALGQNQHKSSEDKQCDSDADQANYDQLQLTKPNEEVQIHFDGKQR